MIRLLDDSVTALDFYLENLRRQLLSLAIGTDQYY